MTPGLYFTFLGVILIAPHVPWSVARYIVLVLMLLSMVGSVSEILR